MSRPSILFATITSLLTLVSAICAYAEEDPEDLIDLVASDGKIIAVIEGRKTMAVDLRLKEQVLWRGSKGYLGACLTDHRFFVISASSGTWQSLPLNSDESEKAVATLSPYLALMVAGDRVVVFDAASDRFIDTQVPLSDELLATKVEKYVAVVVTSGRALGFAAETSGFNEIILRAREDLESVKITSSKAVVITSDRLLSFAASGSGWHEQRID